MSMQRLQNGSLLTTGLDSIRATWPKRENKKRSAAQEYLTERQLQKQTGGG
jgi:hypothetical protein